MTDLNIDDTKTTTIEPGDTGTEAQAPADATATDTTTGTEKPDALAEGDEIDDKSIDEPAADPKVSKARRDAAKYRERARTAEGERDTLRGQYEAQGRQIAEGIAAEEGIAPAALWAGGATLDKLRAADGSIDRALVSAAVKTARDTLGISRFQGGADQGANRKAPADDGTPSWGDLPLERK